MTARSSLRRALLVAVLACCLIFPAAALAAAPVNTVLPAVTGTTQQGSTLTTDNGTWMNSPTSYTYGWYDCNASGAACVQITGQTASSYTLTNTDIGHKIRSTVRAHNADGSNIVSSNATSQVTGPSCTVTLSSLTNVNADLTAGAVVCLSAGTYGSLSITASPASQATLTAAPSAHVVLGGVSLSGGHITVDQIHSTGGITITAGSNYIIDRNDVSNLGGYGIAILAPVGTPSANDVISNNEVHDTSTTSEGDALRFDGISNLTVSGNDVYDIVESETACSDGPCHTDTMQFYNAGTAVSGVTITKNYIHDTTDAQGVPFLKDADYSSVSITDNLSVRMSSVGEVTGMTVQENTPGLTISNNTYVGTSGSNVTPGGSAANPTLNLTKNLFDQFNMTPTNYPINTDSNNIFEQDPWSWSRGASDSVVASPSFKCSTNCGADTTDANAGADDDYELASNPNGIGIDWSPASEVYGPSK